MKLPEIAEPLLTDCYKEVCCICNGSGILENYKEICFHCKGLGKIDWIQNITENKDRMVPKFFYRKCYSVYVELNNLFHRQRFPSLEVLYNIIKSFVEDKHIMFICYPVLSKAEKQLFILIQETGSLTNITILHFPLGSIYFHQEQTYK